MENLPEEEKSVYRISVGDHLRPQEMFVRPLSRLERLKFGVRTLFALAIFLAVVISAFFIGLIIAIPLTLLWMIWLARIAWRLRMRSRFNRF